MKQRIRRTSTIGATLQQLEKYKHASTIGAKLQQHKHAHLKGHWLKIITEHVFLIHRENERNVDCF